MRRDLIHEDGPRISTMRNYRFAIVQYLPKLIVGEMIADIVPTFDSVNMIAGEMDR